MEQMARRAHPGKSRRFTRRVQDHSVGSRESPADARDTNRSLQGLFREPWKGRVFPWRRLPAFETVDAVSSGLQLKESQSGWIRRRDREGRGVCHRAESLPTQETLG